MQTSSADSSSRSGGGEVLWQCSLRMRRANSCKGLQINTSVEDSMTSTLRHSLSVDRSSSIAAEPPTDKETTTTEDWGSSSSSSVHQDPQKPRTRKKKRTTGLAPRRRTITRRVPPDQPQPDTFIDSHVSSTPDWHDESAVCPM